MSAKGGLGETGNGAAPGTILLTDRQMLRFYENHVRVVPLETAQGQDVEDMENAVRDNEVKNEA